MADDNALPKSWSRINGELFGELVFQDIADEYRDTYVIGFVRQLEREDFRLESYYVNQEEQIAKPVHHYPHELTGLLAAARSDEAIASFTRLLDQGLIGRLVEAGMDSLAAYALLHNHPGLERHIGKPLILMAAYIRLYRFEKLEVKNHEAFEEWFPKLFFKNRLTKGVYKALSRIDISDPRSAVSAAEYIIRNYDHMKPLLRGSGVLFPDSIRETIFGVGRHPELIGAKWFYIEQFPNKESCMEVIRLYFHTRELLISALVIDWRRILLKQVSSIDQLHRMHDRYIPESLRKINVPPGTPLPDYDIADNEFFTIVKTAGELLVIADEFRNCVGIFVVPSVGGALVHALYRRGAEKGLMQIDTRNPKSPFITEFKQPFNEEASKRAWEDAYHWLSSCAPENGELSYRALLFEAAGGRPPDSVEENSARYDASALRSAKTSSMRLECVDAVGVMKFPLALPRRCSSAADSSACLLLL